MKNFRYSEVDVGSGGGGVDEAAGQVVEVWHAKRAGGSSSLLLSYSLVWKLKVIYCIFDTSRIT